MTTDHGPTAANPLLLTSREAADILTISERSLWSLTKRGQIVCVRIGKAIRYDAVDLVAFIEGSKSKAA